MGGGDLNLKKSWHPHTMKNQEKVWKAEQAKNEEERKMSDLRKEIENEKNLEDLKRHGEASGVLNKNDGDKKMEWMYKSSTELINRDEYLTGRKIDKAFETLQAEEKQREQNMVGVKQSINHVDHECVPFSIRSYRNFESTEQVDLQRKILEDPLMLIKQREMESRRKLLENPVKLKELHRILKTDQVLQDVKKSKKTKKSKKSKKNHKKRARSSSSSTNSDSDKDLDKKLEKKLRGRLLLKKDEDMAGLSMSKFLDAKYETLSMELDKAVHSKQKTSKNIREHRRHRSSSNNSESSTDRRQQKSNNDAERNRNRQEESRRRYRTRSRTPKRDYQSKYRDYRRTRSRSPQRTRRPIREYLSRNSTYRNDNTANTEYNKKSTTNSKLTEEEKESRRREMMENAAWWETDRTKSVQKHREAYAREEQQNKDREFDKDFINQQVKKAIANQNSVESRIRSNLNNIQRTSSAMNSNFARK